MFGCDYYQPVMAPRAFIMHFLIPTRVSIVIIAGFQAYQYSFDVHFVIIDAGITLIYYCIEFWFVSNTIEPQIIPSNCTGQRFKVL